MKSCLLISAELKRCVGQDRANYELAWHLAEEAGIPVRLVSHYVESPLASHPNVAWRKVPRPLGYHVMGEALLSRAGWREAEAASRLGGRVIVNGGNCPWPDVNWLHAVHSAWEPRPGQAGGLFPLRAAVLRRRARARERQALGAARLVLANSHSARRQAIKTLGLRPEVVHVVYLGVDAEAFKPATPERKAAARRRLGLPGARPIVAFVGALGKDRNKGFDLLLAAWEELCRQPGWDADLVAAGDGAELGLWRARADSTGLARRVRLLGFHEDIPGLLAAADALVSPTHYDAYGMNVHEALCCGLPAFVGRAAGVSERYPGALADLLLGERPGVGELVGLLRRWRADVPGFKERVRAFGAELRRRTWKDMCAQIVGLIEREGGGK